MIIDFFNTIYRLDQFFSLDQFRLKSIEEFWKINIISWLPSLIAEGLPAFQKHGQVRSITRLYRTDSLIISGGNDQNFFDSGFFIRTVLDCIKLLKSGLWHNIEVTKYPLYSLDLTLSNFWLFPLSKHELCGWNFETDAQVIQGTHTICRHIPKKKFVTTIKKWIERMEACLAANRWYFEKENVKCTALESEGDASEQICFYQFFSFPFLEGYMQLFSQKQL